MNSKQSHTNFKTKKTVETMKKKTSTTPTLRGNLYHHFGKKHKSSQNRRTTYIIFGILVGAGIQQQPHAVRMSIKGGTNQRGIANLIADL